MNYGKFNVLFQFDFLVRILVENLIAKDNLKGEKVPNKIFQLFSKKTSPNVGLHKSLPD